jgi:nicotinamide mononucleotide adenylyltransferase
VVNRLRQVTSAIKQAGANQVSVITSSAEREASIEFAKAAAIRPATLGAALREINREREVAVALFEILETQRVLESHAKLTLMPPGSKGILTELLATKSGPPGPGDYGEKR